MSNETALKFETAAGQPSALMTPSQTTTVLIGLGLATSMGFCTYDAVNLILPEIAGSFGVFGKPGAGSRATSACN
jgi:hypothetical protein